MTIRDIPHLADEALLTDLYQLTMMQAYWAEGMNDSAVFTLFVRRLPPNRNYLLACGIEEALQYLERVHFSADAIEYLASLGRFDPRFLEWLAAFRFRGDVYAVPEGTPVFGNEPILEVVAPIAEAQLAETYLMNQVHLQTLLASKASRVVAAAKGREVVDFGLRRIHGTDAGLKSARAFYIAGVAATSNVLAGKLYRIPVAGTMAHSYIQAHDHEKDAFRAFLRGYPDAILLVDTYDTLEGVGKVIELAEELGDEFRAAGIRLDSGDLGQLATDARRLLDAAGLQRVQIFASGGLDEYGVAALLEQGAPIDGFGVGTGMGVSQDQPYLDIVYKLSEYAGEGRVKTSPDKPVLPGRKQVYRIEEEGRAIRDVIAGRDEEGIEGRPLLRKVMEGGRPLPDAYEPLSVTRQRAETEIATLPARLLSIETPAEPYPVEITPALRRQQQKVAERARE